VSNTDADADGFEGVFMVQVFELGGESWENGSRGSSVWISREWSIQGVVYPGSGLSSCEGF